ncbi:DUF1007 family protein [Pseudodesulfovibrio sediminis]|uniref:Nickel/cobalt efflux system n=1 Tax=Pseudodesulfovibrio sediminis TaxID=2810563 RepID=A0ABN6EWN0_9BACT|nr:DUF1007 family protein [Pseudodesulfovibrio sediminis]BCS89426.1 hypothetical protein PSDVSF_26680 [Pseudodesulfovibrio sediminis]
MKKALFTLLILTCLLPIKASGHPHVYVDVSLVFSMDDTGLTSVHQQWIFDDIFTQAILGDLELTPQTLPAADSQETIRTGAFAYLANYDYFTFIESAGKQLPVGKPRNFKASLQNDRLVYDFTLPLDLPYAQMQDFRLAVFDKEYYTDIIYAELNPVRFDIQGGATARYTIRPAKDHTYWKFIVPKAVHLSVSGTPAADTGPADAELGTIETPGAFELVMNTVRAIQKELTIRLNNFGKEIRDDPFGPALWLFLGLSFVYGVVHAVGPGHGKAVVCSYFLSNPGSLMTGALMGNAITFVHMLSAAAAVGVAYIVFSSGMGGFAEASRAIQPASYGLLTLMGCFLLVKSLRDSFKGGLLTAPTCEHGVEEEGDNIRSVLLVSFVTGLIPCPGAAVILAFSISLNIFWAGVMSLIIMAAGMGLTTTLFAWFAVTARSVTLQLSSSNRKVFNGLYAALSICGAGAIALFGSVLLLGSICS